MFCVECGAEGPTYGGVCATCFAKKHPLLEPPANLDLPRCKSCGRFRFRAGWSKTDLGSAIPQVLSEQVGPLPPFTGVRFAHESHEEDENNYFLTVEARGRHEDLEQVQEFRVRLRIKPSLCDLCQKQAGRYFEGILQVRGDGRDLTPDEVRRVRTMVLARVERGREDGGDFLSKIEEVHGGLDFYVSTNALGLRLAKEVAEAMGGTVASSPKLYGQRAGKELYRVTSLVRLPAVQVGDVVRHKGILVEVLERKGFLSLRDLASGEVRRYKAKDLRGLRRVEAERFEAEIRVDERGHTLAVHPESGAERDVDLRGATPPPHVVVVWTAEGAYLSGLRAAGSKD